MNHSDYMPILLLHQPFVRPKDKMGGVVLVVTLIVLVLVSLLGVASVRQVTFQERLTGNAVDRYIALQAAEVALREGEAIAQSQSTASPPNEDFPQARIGSTVNTTLRRGIFQDTDLNSCDVSPCSDGLCSQPDLLCIARWDDSSLTWRTATTAMGFNSGNAPQFIVEFLGNTFSCDPNDATASTNCSRYRITARSNPGDGRATVTLQSIYVTD